MIIELPSTKDTHKLTGPFSDLLERSVKPSRLAVGLMSGTSADAIDVAICGLQGQGTEIAVTLIHYREYAHDPDVKHQLLRAPDLNLRALAELHVLLGEAFASAVLRSLKEASVAPDEVDIIGSHGQTVYHHSGVAGALRATLQLGDADIIAVRTGRHVLSDFRARDIAAGGEGCALSPIADRILFADPNRTSAGRRAILNLGGIANFTVLDDDPEKVFGFDAGPANGPLDRLARSLSGGTLACDRDGRFARAGRVNERLLADLLESDPFLLRSPPKSTGFEMYGDDFVDRAAHQHGQRDADLMATLTEFSARAVALGLRQCVSPGPAVTEVIAAGGGVNNPALMERIAALIAPIPLRLPMSSEFPRAPARPWYLPSWPT